MKSRSRAPLAALLLAAALLLPACASSGGGGGRSTSDPRVRSFAGRQPPGLGSGGRVLKAHPSHVAGPGAGPDVVVRYMQFAFPT